MMQVSAEYQPVMRELGLDGEGVFEHPLIKPWRQLPDRENCTLEATLQDGRSIRWHVKRYPSARGAATPAEDEVQGHRLLEVALIPTAKLIAWGKLSDRRSFVIFEDLSGHRPCDKLVESGMPFERMAAPTADLAARLHRAGLHHRDLYLCHFLARMTNEPVDVRLIDTARVRRLPRLFRRRWIVKDLAQFWYSTTKLPVSEAQRDAWLGRYAEQAGMGSAGSLRRKILRKANWIAAHDAKLRRQQPRRNISIPTSGGGQSEP